MGKDMQEIEKTLWAAADKMIGGLSVTNYKFVVLGLIFLKYISDTFEEKYNDLVKEGYGLEEDRDAYMEDNIFFVPEESRWSYIVNRFWLFTKWRFGKRRSKKLLWFCCLFGS